jgi:hypothetical protein
MLVKPIANRLLNKNTHGAEVEQQAQAGDAQAAAAYRDGEKAKTSRARILAIGALAFAGIGVYGMHEVKDGIKSVFDAAVPHDSIQTRVDSELTKIRPANDAVLVVAEGSSAAKVHGRAQLEAPVVGWIFNKTAARLTDFEAYTKRTAQLHIVAPRGSVKLSAAQAVSPKTGKLQWYPTADIAVEQLQVNVVNPNYANENGERVVSESSDIGRRLLDLFSGDSGTATRLGGITEWADSSFRNNCGSALTPNIKVGAKMYTADFMRGVAGVIEKTGRSDNAGLLRTLADRPAIVTFSVPKTSVDGTVSRHAIGEDAIQLPKDSIPTAAQVAKELDQPIDRVETSVGTCSFSPEAVQDQMKILGIEKVPAY